jgi:hypothetical protein
MGGWPALPGCCQRCSLATRLLASKLSPPPPVPIFTRPTRTPPLHMASACPASAGMPCAGLCRLGFCSDTLYPSTKTAGACVSVPQSTSIPPGAARRTLLAAAPPTSGRKANIRRRTTAGGGRAPAGYGACSLPNPPPLRACCWPGQRQGSMCCQEHHRSPSAPRLPYAHHPPVKGCSGRGRA